MQASQNQAKVVGGNPVTIMASLATLLAWDAQAYHLELTKFDAAMQHDFAFL
jgi:hypothetical protein